MVGLNVRYNGAEAGTTGMTVPVTEGDTAERLTDGDNFVLILQLSDGTTKEIRLGEDGSRLECTLTGVVEANIAYTCKVIYKDFSVTLTFVAPPAVPTIEIKKDLGKTYDGTPVSLGAEDMEIVGESTPVITWYVKNDDGTYRGINAAPKDVGVYKAVVLLPGSKHFSEGITEAEFEITKAEPQVSEPQFAPVYYEGEVTKLSDIVLPAGYAWDNADTVLTLGKATYTATYTDVDTHNYKVRTFEWELTCLRPIAPPMIMGSYTYDPDAKAVLELDGFDGETMCFAVGSDAPEQVNAGTYRICVDLKDPGKTCWLDKSSATVELTWTIEKRTAEYEGEAPTIDGGTYEPGRTLADIALPDAVRWRWEAPETPATCDRKFYAALFCPTGFEDTNYLPAEVTVTVTVARASAWDDPMKPGTVTVYDDEVESLADIDPNAGLDRTRGIFRFKDGQTLAPGRKEKEYELYFIPADTVNYAIVRGIRMEICYRRVLTVPTAADENVQYLGGTAITLSFNGYDDTLMEVRDADGQTLTLQQTDAGVYAYFFHLKDGDAYAWADHTTEAKTVVFTIAPIKVARPTPVRTVAVLDASGKVTFSWNGWNDLFDGYSSGAGSAGLPPLTNGEMTATFADTFGVRVSLRDRKNTVWEDGTSYDFTVYFTALAEDPVTSVTKNGVEIGLDGLTTADFVIGDKIVITTKEGYSVYADGMKLTDNTYTVTAGIGTYITLSVKPDGGDKAVYSTTKTVRSPFTRLALNGKPLTFAELADAILYRGSHLTYDTCRDYIVRVEGADRYGRVSVAEEWTSFTLEIVYKNNLEAPVFSHTYTVHNPVLSVTVDGVEKDVEQVTAGEIVLPVGSRVVFTLADGFILRVGEKTYASGDVLTMAYYNGDISVRYEDSYREQLNVRVDLAESITVNGKEIRGSYEMADGEEELVFRVTSRLPFEWSAEYADGTRTDYAPAEGGTFTVSARGLVSVQLSFELEPHSTASKGISIYTHTNIASIGVLYPELGGTDLVRGTLYRMAGGNYADYDLWGGFIAGFDLTFKEGFTGTYRVKREDGTIIDRNGTWVNGGYGDVVSLGRFLTLEILDGAGTVVETRTLRYNVQQSLRWTGAGGILTGDADDPAYLYTAECTLDTEYDTDARIRLVFGYRTGVQGILPTVTVNGGKAITFTERDVYTPDCVIVYDLGDGRRFEYRTEIVVNLTENIGDFLDGDNIVLADKTDSDKTTTLYDPEDNRSDSLDSETIVGYLHNGFNVQTIVLNARYLFFNSESRIVVRNARAFLQLTFCDQETGLSHTVLIHLTGSLRIDGDTTVDDWYVGQFGDRTGTVTPDGDTLTLEDFNSTKSLIVSPRGYYTKVGLYAADGTLLHEEYGTTDITFPGAGIYTLRITSTDGTAVRTYKVVVKGAFDPLFEIVAGEGDDERTLRADLDDEEEGPKGDCYLYYDDDYTFLIGYFGRGMQAYIVTIDGVEYLPVRFRSCLAGQIYADEACTQPLTAGRVSLAVLTEAGRRYVTAYLSVSEEVIGCRFYLEDNTYSATVKVGDTEYNLRVDENSTDYGDAVMGEDGITLTVPASAARITTVTLKLTRVSADESYTVIDYATGNIYRVTDQDTLTVEIPVSFGEDGCVVLLVCPEGSTDTTSNTYPLLIVLAAE